MYHPGHTIHVTKTWRTWSKINVEEDSDGEPAMTEDTRTHTETAKFDCSEQHTQHLCWAVLIVLWFNLICDSRCFIHINGKTFGGRHEPPTFKITTSGMCVSVTWQESIFSLV